jgi:hypothetical protein
VKKGGLDGIDIDIAGLDIELEVALVGALVT